MSLLKSIKIDMPTDEEIQARAENRYKSASQNPNQFSYWYPTVVSLGINAPKTAIFPLSRETSDIAMRENLTDEMVQSDPLLDALAEKVKSCFDSLGSENLFIKNSLFSSKHAWEKSCFITKDSDINNQIMNIIYSWACNSPDYATEFIVREMIDTHPVFHAFYGKMPVTEEYRFFSKDGVTYAYQPYWPKLSIQDPSCDDWESKLESISNPSSELVKLLSDMASKVTESLTGDWSVDFLIDKDGKPWLIDMALSNQSYKSPEKVDLTK